MDVTLNINDTVCSNSCRNTIENNITFTSQNDSYNLQCGFTVNVIFASDTQYTVLIQNGKCVIIRNILNNVQTSLLLPEKCRQHIVTFTRNT